jgi:uncharacterized NAD-dependent epimerase/dehydratase family protein
MLVLKKPYLLYLGDVQTKADAKTAFGLRDWCRADVIGEWSLAGCPVTLHLPRLSPAEAAASGAGSVVVGVAVTGGRLPAHWQDDLEAALRAGLDVVSGMHTRLAEFPRLVAAAQASGARLADVRHIGGDYPCASGRKRRGLRVLTVGTDCALGKKYTALALTQELTARGTHATFRATGQTGIMIAGSGVPMDRTISDFIAGAAEVLSPDAPEGHWDVIEGQGSLYHPAYAAVTLGLLHGSQPDAIVLCHDPLRTTIDEYPDYPIPDLQDAIDYYLAAGRLTNRAIRCVGLSINSSGLNDADWSAYRSRVSAQLGLPVCDPLRGGLAAIADRLLAP